MNKYSVNDMVYISFTHIRKIIQRGEIIKDCGDGKYYVNIYNYRSNPTIVFDYQILNKMKEIPNYLKNS